MSVTAPTLPAKKQIAKITSKGQITIPAETRRLLGVKPGDKLVFEPTPDGIKVLRQIDENIFEKMRGIGTGIPELDNGSIDDIVRWFREARGHDEVDDLIFGTER
jgi:AbrB family looped-hinge helix DNA binding protein